MERTGTAENQNLMEFLFPVAKKTLYFDLFGRAGFAESQVLFPHDQFKPAIRSLKMGLDKFGAITTLASCKLFRGTPEFLRFKGDGIAIALDFPRNRLTNSFLDWWDDVVIDNGGIPNLSKDSRLTRNTVERCYPQFNLFLERLHTWDEKRRFHNSFSRRLGL
jgi:decaprenylphospho-beta-D-ribofuranose 2-oxidase